ncbi:MAG: chorismate mutase [Polyangiaceae bacterium]
MERLEELRREIDRIDDEILKWVAERLDRVMAVGDYKREHGLGVYDPNREREILDRLAARAPGTLDGQAVRRIFERLIDESRHAEQRRVRGE